MITITVYVGDADDALNSGAEGSCPTAAAPKAVGKPVNVTNGNVYVQQTDYHLPGMGDGLEITRTFNSANTGRTGLFGNGWSTQYDKSLNVYGAKLLRLNLADGRAVYFKGLTATTFVPLSPLNFYGQIEKTGSGYTLLHQNGSVDQRGNCFRRRMQTAIPPR